MSDAVIISLINGIFLLSGICLTIYMNRKLNVIKKDINGRLTELLNLTRKSSNAEGNLEGREELKQEQSKIE